MALDDFPMELKPEGDLVITFNADQPGVIGEVGIGLRQTRHQHRQHDLRP